MIEALYISENALKAGQQWVSKISHNIANINTPGYKRNTVHFSDLVSGEANGKSVESIGLGSEISSTTTDFSVGQLKQTNQPLDTVIDGAGFFEVILPNGDLGYTRRGQFGISDSGELVLRDGTFLSDGVYLPADTSQVNIAADGTVSAILGSGLNVVEVGQLTLTRFMNPETLKPMGNGIYMPTELSGEATPRVPGEDGVGRLVQGYIEMSNVDLVDEMSNIMLAQRSYQINARLLQASDQILETINNLRR